MSVSHSSSLGNTLVTISPSRLTEKDNLCRGVRDVFGNKLTGKKYFANLFLSGGTMLELCAVYITLSAYLPVLPAGNLQKSQVFAMFF